MAPLTYLLTRLLACSLPTRRPRETWRPRCSLSALSAPAAQTVYIYIYSPRLITAPHAPGGAKRAGLIRAPRRAPQARCGSGARPEPATRSLWVACAELTEQASGRAGEAGVSAATAPSMRVTRPTASALSLCALVSCVLSSCRRSRQARASASSPATSAVCAAAYA